MQIELIQFQNHGDERGGLIVAESGKEIPFTVKRIYYMSNFPCDIRRGFHAHKRISQIVIPLKGSCTFLIDNGNDKKEVVLNQSDKGLLLGPKIWREIYNFSEDCLLLVLASEAFDEDEYIRDYDKFLTFVSLNK